MSTSRRGRFRGNRWSHSERAQATGPLMAGRAWGVLLKAADNGANRVRRIPIPSTALGTHRDRPTQPRMIERLVGRQPRMIKRLVLPGSDNCPCRRMGWCSLMAALLKGSSRSWLSKLQTSAPRMLTEVGINKHPIATFLVLVYAATTALTFVPGARTRARTQRAPR